MQVVRGVTRSIGAKDLWQLEQEMKRRRISRAKLGTRMKINRAAIDRLFANNQSSVTLQFLEQAALALGRKLKVELC